MADYSKLTEQEIRDLLGSYQLGTIASVSPMKGGQANTSFKIVTDNESYILSVCDEKNTQEVNCLTRVLIYLKQKKFPTSQLVVTKSGKFFITYKNKPVILKKYLVGEPVRYLSPQMLASVGQAMAVLHDIPPLMDVMPNDFPYGTTSFDEVLGSGYPHPYIEWLKRKKDYLEQTVDQGMEQGLVHGDIFWDNLLFLNGRLIAVLDFEEACQYYKLYDIGMCAVGCCGRNGQFDMEGVASLLDGYQKKQRLSLVQKKQLRVFMEYAAVAGSFWRFRQYHIKYPNPEMASSYEELSSLADHIHHMPEKQFLSFFD